MSVNKDAALRYRIINDCLRNNLRRWTKRELLDTINEKLLEHYQWDSGRIRTQIKERQLNYDINAMRSLYGAPIEQKRDGRTYFYCYEDLEYNIEQQHLSDEDLSHLREAVHLLHQIKGFSISQDIEAVVSRLENRITTGQEASASIIAFENPPSVQGIDYLGDLYQAIIRKNVLRIHYQPFAAPEGQDHTIHPYFLKEYNNRWFLFGWNDGKERIDNMPLDRMNQVKVIRGSYRPNSSFYPEAFFADMIGVTRPMDAVPETIEIWLSADRAPYVLSKPMHHSQALIQRYDNGSILLQMHLVVNRELLSTLLSFGAQMEVTKPAYLREQIKANLKAALDNYI